MKHPEEEYLEKAKGGDKDALSKLLRRYGPPVRSGLDINPKYRRVLDADDIMQVTYLEAFQHIARFEGDRRAFPAWLRKIAKNNLLDAITGLECEKRPPAANRMTPPEGQDSMVWLHEFVAGTGTTPSGAASREEMRRILEAEVDKLPADYAKVLRLMYFEGKSPAEAAEVMGRTRGAVHLLRKRAVDALRQVFGAGSKFFSH